MAKLNSIEDTITAIATPLGVGGIGIIRISGKDAIAIAGQLFRSKANGKVSEFAHASVHYGWIVDSGGDIIDETLLMVMRAPRSYTREDVVEIHCHGGTVSLKAILTRVSDMGARLAEPGEFTKRAFLNGRIDLAQAEAVLDIIQSKTDAFLQVSTHQLKGDLSRELDSIREGLMKIYVECEAYVNFPEDDIDTENIEKIVLDIDHAKKRVEQLLSTGDQGKILKEGIKIVICGRPNVGKSSLLNSLLKTPRAIVSDIAGTTRDTIEETAQIDGIPFQLIDTAGILDPRDLIEEEAVKRSHMHIKGADLVILVMDRSESLIDEDRKLIEQIKGQNVMAVLNKNDLPAKIDVTDINRFFPEKDIVVTSIIKKEGVEDLQKKIVESVTDCSHIDTHGILVSNLRHIQALKDCAATLAQTGGNLNNGMSLEFISEDIKQAVNFLDGITGRNIDADLLDTIFSQFCIGK